MSAQDNLGPQWWHGTPDERTWEHGAAYGIHVGTHKAATSALESRIGRPAEGTWDGQREYGKTLLDRNTRSHMMHGTPPNVTWEEKTEHHPPSYPTGRASYSESVPIPMDARPNVFGVEITGPMTNTPSTPHDDFKANGYMKAALKRGNAKSGYYYRNVSEDEGSISAVVPSAQHLRRVPGGQQPSSRKPPLLQGLPGSVA